MMIRSMLRRLTCLSVAIGLVAACGPTTRSLGEDAAGGKTSGTTGGAKGTTGGASGTTGGTGGQGSVVPYVDDPTLPIDPSCTCDSGDNICNAASQCVPRCDDSGRCARWLANHAVVDLLVEGTSLYYAVAAATDPLGNPANNGSLYRIETTGGVPTLIAGGLVNPYRILGRYAGVTYIETSVNAGTAIASISDAGAVSNLDQDVAWGEEAAMMWGHWLAYLNSNRSKLIGIDLSSNLTPVVLAQVPTSGDPLPQIQGPAVLRDQILYNTANPYQICSIQLANVGQGATCADGGGSFGQSNQSLAVATAGDQYFSNFGGPGSTVSSYSPPNTRLLTLFSPGASGVGDSVGNLVYANSWLYVDVQQETCSSRLIRVPTTVGRLPQAILPDSMATRDSVTTYTGGGCSVGSIVVAVSAKAFFWVQSIDPKNSNLPQYIFSAPLPPQPCDAELPCADSTQVCSNGLCG